MLKNYLLDIFNTAKTGDAREESFYSALEKLFEEFITQKGKNYSVTILPKKTEAGNPDFRIWDDKQKIIGYIEAKTPTVKDLEIIQDHILKNFFAFELMMAPYAVGHLKIGLILDEYGYKLADDERFNLFLTNTLELSKEESELPDVMERAIAKESEEALKVKEKIPILVIFGNPPYSISSANKTDFIEKEMEFYKEDVREERNIQPLSDDYIKFIRFAHWKIENAGFGVVGMITNNSYLSGLIHRGMRKKLADLHLLKSSDLNNPIAKFYGDNSNKVEKREYREKGRRIYINDFQYFEGITPEVWNYYIGGYQVLDKWLKDRKGQSLTSEDIKHYCKTATAISKTVEIQIEIDKYYPKVEETL